MKEYLRISETFNTIYKHIWWEHLKETSSMARTNTKRPFEIHTRNENKIKTNETHFFLDFLWKYEWSRSANAQWYLSNFDPLQNKQPFHPLV